MTYIFKWDEEKNRLNILKHGITFEEGATVFDDKKAIYLPDDTHSIDEERFIVIGFSDRAKLLLVCHCYQDDDSIIRIISVRKTTKREELEYEQQ